MNPEKLFLDNVKLVPFTLRKFFPALAYDEDLAQEGLLALWRACKAYDERFENTFSTFAVVCIRNGVLRALRHQKGPEILSLDGERSSQNGEGEFSLADLLEDPGARIEDGVICIQEFIQGLDGRDREIIGFQLEGLTQKQGSKRLGISQPQYCRRLKRLRAKYESRYA